MPKGLRWWCNQQWQARCGPNSRAHGQRMRLLNTSERIQSAAPGTLSNALYSLLARNRPLTTAGLRAGVACGKHHSLGPFYPLSAVTYQELKTPQAQHEIEPFLASTRRYSMPFWHGGATCTNFFYHQPM